MSRPRRRIAYFVSVSDHWWDPPRGWVREPAGSSTRVARTKRAALRAVDGAPEGAEVTLVKRTRRGLWVWTWEGL